MPRKRKYSSQSRLKRLEERKNKKQAIQFGLLSVGFILLLIFIIFPLFIKVTGTIGDARSSGSQIDKGDIIAPAPPNLISQFEATSSALVNLSGYSESGSTVYLMVNGNDLADILIEEDGSFKFEDIALTQGPNEIYCYAKDQAENQSQDSRKLEIIFDSQAPDLEISSPNDGDKFYDDEKELVVAGTTDNDATIRVNGYISTVDNEGNFVKKIQLKNGENEIKVEASDDAGNKTEETIKVSYTP
jgi:glucodextranase-like protein